MPILKQSTSIQDGEGESTAPIVTLGLQRKLSVVLFLAVTLVMGGRGYLSFVQTLNSQREKIELDLSQLEATFHAIHERSSKELFRLADQLRVPAENEMDSGENFSPSLISGIESIYYLDNSGAVLSSSIQAGSNAQISEKQINEAVKFLRREQRPHANLNCLSQCFQSVFIPVIADDGRELIININRSAAVLIQDYYAITGSDIALFSISKNSDALVVDKVFVASNAEKVSSVLLDILKSRDYSSQGSHVFFDATLSGFYSARFFPLSQHDGVISYAAIMQDQRHIKAIIIQAIKDIIFSTVITLVLVVLLIGLILKPSLDRVMRLAEVLPMLPKGQFSEAKILNRWKSKKKYSDEIDVLQYTVGEVVDSLEEMSASVSQHRDELKLKIEALTDAKAFNELILDTSPLVVVIHDRSGVIYNINKLGRELTGLLSDSPVGENINSWVKNEHSDKSLSSLLSNNVEVSGKKYQGEMAFFTDSGQKLYFLWTHTGLQINDETHILSIGIDITERKETAQSLYWLGEHDRITGLLNRSSFTESASELIAKYSVSHHIELVMFDIDDFAIFNDRFGFDSGDRLLNCLAAHLAQVLPEYCLLARTGSDEFCAIIQHTKHSGLGVKDLSLDSLTRYTFNHKDISEEVCISVVVDCYDDALSGIDELISNSTSTMANVKSRIKGGFHYATESGDSSKQLRQMKYRMRAQLQSALAENRLVVFYQPILDIASNSISHCECLVRMLDSEGEFIPPVHFLGIAAESGLMPQLDFSVMEKAMCQQRLWEDSGIHIGLSINITAFTMGQADFEARLVDMISRTGANPARLIFEVVETDALENLGVARKLLNNIKNVGAKVALDDFGIGFTSFEYVRELPVDYIKIDQSFIRFIHERESDQILVRSMVEMSHNLGKKVIVEGVEHREAFDIVREIGVECVQGYYVCRPVPISALDLSLSISDV